MRVTIRQLEVFDALASLGSVTRAADSLAMSQSAASSALLDLQAALRRPLFMHKKGRPLQITDEGRRLHTEIRSLLSGIRDLEQPDDDADLSGRLVIGATALVAETVLPDLCMQFKKRHPHVQFQIEAEPVQSLLQRMTNFELETVLIEVLPQIEGIELISWRSDELILVVATDHPLAGRSGIAIEDLAGFEWCTREAHSSITARLRYLTNERLGPIPVSFEATSNWAVRRAVIAGGGIGCLSRALVQFDLDNGRLVRLDVPSFHFPQTISLARPRNIARSRLNRAFDSFLLEQTCAPPID
jgi:DNA-binding transcriptional LysR family regulator